MSKEQKSFPRCGLLFDWPFGQSFLTLLVSRYGSPVTLTSLNALRRILSTEMHGRLSGRRWRSTTMRCVKHGMASWILSLSLYVNSCILLSWPNLTAIVDWSVLRRGDCVLRRVVPEPFPKPCRHHQCLPIGNFSSTCQLELSGG